MAISEFEYDQIIKFEYLGKIHNKWRQRYVHVYQHPTNPNMVITVGFPYNGGQAVICDEEYSDSIRQALRTGVIE